MSTIFDKFKGDVDLSIFKKSNTDPKTPLRRHYLSLVGLLEYVDIINDELTGRSLPEGITVDAVKGMIVHGIGDIDTVKVMSDGDSKVKPKKHEYVDLGLPSGTLWATTNIQDADGNELYFAWGETQGYTADQVGKEEGKREFTWDGEDNDYAFGPINWDDYPNYGMKKYSYKDGLTELEPKDDAATVNWSNDWKMPTKEQFEELIANTSYEWTEIDGVPGAKFTSTVKGYTDKFLFFPAVGYPAGGEVNGVGGCGSYWSVSLDDEHASYASSFFFNDSGCNMSCDNRYRGYSVRPVCPEQHEYVDLGLKSGTLWATENIKDANGSDLYFAWGETQGYTADQVGKEEGKRVFDWSGYKWGNKGECTRYNGTDKLTVLEPVDDAATTIWGKDWRMPTEEQFKELIKDAKHEWTEINGVHGVKFYSAVDESKFVFFPACGTAKADKSYDIGGIANYWTSSLNDDDDANFLGGSKDGVKLSEQYRCYGYPVHPVHV